MRISLLPASALLLLSACAAERPVAAPIVERPLDVLPSGLDPALVRADLVATARAKIGNAAVDRALGSPTHLIVKRFAGMAPPPPPGAGAGWTPPTPTALLMRDGERWLVAAETGWRPANAEAAAQINAILADGRFWTEPRYTQACPDFGSSNVLLKIPGKSETVRIAQCTSIAASLVEAALRG